MGLRDSDDAAGERFFISSSLAGSFEGDPWPEWRNLCAYLHKLFASGAPRSYDAARAGRATGCPAIAHPRGVNGRITLGFQINGSAEWVSAAPPVLHSPPPRTGHTSRAARGRKGLSHASFD